MTDPRTDRPRQSPERTDADEAPELHNSEQDDEMEQSQSVADEALAGAAQKGSPLDSVKDDEDSGLMGDSTQDLIDRMRDMEQSGRIDMDAYRGEPNHDDNQDKYAKANRVDNLPSDGS